MDCKTKYTKECRPCAIDVCYIMNGTRRYRAKYGDFYDAKPSSFLFMPGLSERRNDVRWD